MLAAWNVLEDLLWVGLYQASLRWHCEPKGLGVFVRLFLFKYPVDGM